MVKNNFKIAIRHLWKNRTITLLNFAGLTIALATAFVIGLHVRHEWLTDSFAPAAERTFRAVRISGIEGKPYQIGITSPNFAAALRSDFPDDVEETCRFYPDHIFVTVGEKRFHERKFAYADAHFFQFFNLKLLYGDAATALSDINSVVLTEKTATKLFGSPDAAMGKTIRWDNRKDLQVSGIFAGLPTNSHIEFDYLAPIEMFKNEDWWTVWWNNLLCTYVRLRPGATAASLDARLPGFMDKYFGKDFAESGGRIDLAMQPLREIYWNAETRYDPVRHGNRRATEIFALAAVLLLVIAAFNFINLATARAGERSREVGVRKTLGATRPELSRQFLTESMLIAGVSMAAAVFLTFAALPVFNQVFDLNLSFNSLKISEFVAWTGGLTLLVGLGAGIYPAGLLSNFRAVEVLKNKPRLGGGAVNLRRGLTIFQFTLSVMLLVSTLVVWQQLEFLKNKNLGFDRENVVVIETWGTGMRREKLNSYRQKIENYPTTLGATCSDVAPGSSPDASIIHFVGRTERPKINLMYADFQFVPTLKLQLASGRNFSSEHKTDSTRAALLNRAACRLLGIEPEKAVGMQLTPVYFDSLKHEVVGVVEDYHFLNLRQQIEPLVILPDYRYPGTLAVRSTAGGLEKTLELLKNDWETLNPERPFEFRMLDERLDELYKLEQKQGKMFGFFAAVALLIACLGMFGLATLLALQRTKEIGIRKVLGATVASIAGLLTRDFLKLVVVAVLVASPLAYFFMKNWLENFAYRIEIGWWVFAAAGFLAVLIACLTVGFQSVRAALANPVRSLRSE